MTEDFDNRIKYLEKRIKLIEHLLILIVIIMTILTIILIGSYVGMWGGVYIRDPNNPGLPLTQILLGCF